MYTASAAGINQGHYDPVQHTLVGCASCTAEGFTHLVEARWKPSLTIPIPPGWPTGVYYVVLMDTQGKWTFHTFVVRGDWQSAYLAILPETTRQAYNDWGGYSLYHGPDGAFTTRATKVSFDRPLSGPPFDHGLAYEIDAIRWMERMGYDLSYATSVDLHERSDQLLSHKAYLSLGHDEYWSKEMRDGVERARDVGVGLIFLGANAAYWQIRFEPDGLHKADRTIVCYKWPADDPLHATDSARVTYTWRDLGRPENALIGVMYSSHSGDIGFPWQLDPAAAASSLIQGTGLTPGTSYGCDFVGYEWDRVFDNGATPPGLHILATSATVNTELNHDVSNTSYYVAQSGALVFATGSIYWAYALDSFRVLPSGKCIGQSRANPGMQRLMANVMEAAAAHHPQGWL
jgi:hypothetical protein